MTVYEVDIAVDAAVAEDYAAWLGRHIREILALDGFLGADWFEVEGEETAGRVRWCVRYRLRDRAALQRYFDAHAARLRGDGLGRFGGRFEITRRIMTHRRAFEAAASEA